MVVGIGSVESDYIVSSIFSVSQLDFYSVSQSYPISDQSELASQSVRPCKSIDVIFISQCH